VGEQLHVGPQLQAGPQLQRSSEWHDADGRAAGFWQPQVHSEPVQAAHAQTFDRVDMRSSLLVVDVMSTMKRVSHRGGQPGLNGTAIVVERIGYLAGRVA
jgi:hypothetical protein